MGGYAAPPTRETHKGDPSPIICAQQGSWLLTGSLAGASPGYREAVAF